MANIGTVEPVASVSDDNTSLIELSNRCQELYNSRLKKAERTKQKLRIQEKSTCLNGQTNGKKKTSLDNAMETLRKEMISLIDQDLSLMRHMLILNEAVEDLKSHRKYFDSKWLTVSSSCDLSESEWSVSLTDLHEINKDSHLKCTNGSSLSMHSCIRRHCNHEDHLNSPKNPFTNVQITHDNRDNSRTGGLQSRQSIRHRRYLETEFSSNDCPISVYHVYDNSFDSGIDEPLWPLETSV